MGYYHNTVMAIAVPTLADAERIIATTKLAHPEDAEWFMQHPQYRHEKDAVVVWWVNNSKRTPEELYGFMADLLQPEEPSSDTWKGAACYLRIGDEQGDISEQRDGDGDLDQFLWDFSIRTDITTPEANDPPEVTNGT